MQEEPIQETLQSLAHYMVRNEMLSEHCLQSLGVSQNDIGAKVRELDAQLQADDTLRKRFPELFPE